MDRRDFLKIAAAGSVVVASEQVLGRRDHASPTEASTHSWAMAIDLSRCNGCEECVLACRAHNDVPSSISWTRIVSDEGPGEQVEYLPLLCMHCEHPPCAEVCLVSATRVRPDGIVMMDYDRCLGCRYCQLACPYGARSFNWSKNDGENQAVPEHGQPEIERRPRGVPEKCSFCYQRIDRGMSLGLVPGVDEQATPACTVACPRDARIFGDLNDDDSPISKVLREHRTFRLKEDLGASPRVYYFFSQAEDEG